MELSIIRHLRWRYDNDMGANCSTTPVRLQYSGSLWVRTHYMPKHVPTCGRGLVGGFKFDFLFFLFNWLIIGVLCVDFQIRHSNVLIWKGLCCVVGGDIGVCYLVENL